VASHREGKKFGDDQLDIMKFPVKNWLMENSMTLATSCLTKFLSRNPLPSDPICVQDEKAHYILDQKFAEVFDGEWLVNNVAGKPALER
jgi:hypothetical protein